MRSVAVADFQGWREAARALLAEDVPPQDVNWLRPGQNDLLAAPEPSAAAQAGAFRVPRALVDLLAQVGNHRDAGRFALMYRVLWRVLHGEPDAASPADADGSRLAAMAAAVRHDAHRMKAFLRFEPVPDAAPGEPAWRADYAPEHHVLEHVAPHFADRFGRESWLIRTPDGQAHWDGAQLRFAPPDAASPVRGAPDPLWQAYYRGTFNPVRNNPQALQRHMPVRFWNQLPEAQWIPALTAAARSGELQDSRTVSCTGQRGAVFPDRAAPASPHLQRPDADGPVPPGLPAREVLDACRRCPLWEPATQAVGGTGPADARIMLIGEQPGDEEDLRGEPFVGPAGRLLDRAIAQAGLAREALYLGNAVKHFKWEPRGRRRLHKTPAQKEVDACNPWLVRELQAVQPRVVVALGATALRGVLQAAPGAGWQAPVLNGGLTRNVGSVQSLGDDGRVLLPCWHPSYALRVPDEDAQARVFDTIVETLVRARELAERDALAGLARGADGEGFRDRQDRY